MAIGRVQVPAPQLLHVQKPILFYNFRQTIPLPVQGWSTVARIKNPRVGPGSGPGDPLRSGRHC